MQGCYLAWKEKQVLMQKCCSLVENVKVERSREGSLLLPLSQWWPLECFALRLVVLQAVGVHILL